MDDEHCANSILSAAEVIDHCWPVTSSLDFKPWITCALRIVKLYSTHGDERIRQPFEDAMRDQVWGLEREGLLANEIAIRSCLRAFWHYSCANFVTLVEEELNQLELRLRLPG
jgi:hypothetical protein